MSQRKVPKLTDIEIDARVLDNSVWETLFPNGRDIYYEGEHSETFAAEMVAKFGFDPSSNNPNWNRGSGFRFHCPGHLMDKVYGGDYPLGS